MGLREYELQQIEAQVQGQPNSPLVPGVENQFCPGKEAARETISSLPYAGSLTSLPSWWGPAQVQPALQRRKVMDSGRVEDLEDPGQAISSLQPQHLHSESLAELQ